MVVPYNPHMGGGSSHGNGSGPDSWSKTGVIAGVVGAIAAVVAILVAVLIAAGDHDSGAQTASKAAPASAPNVEADTTPQSGDAGPQCSAAQVAAGWGPERERFTLASSAPHPVFNSISDNDVFGNEFDFVSVKDANDTDEGGWCDSIEAADGDVLWLRLYVENSASDLLADDNWEGTGMALDTRARFEVQTERSTRVEVTGFVTSSTTQPMEIWDGIEVISPDVIRLDPVNGSEILYSNAHGNGIDLNYDLWSPTGTPLGYEQLDGRMRPGYQYSVYVFAKVRVTAVG
ncbi:hypothetical protein E6P97_02510 [Patescibacteria group bacterium]|nr:MAG: hypothetical protein E6P97_02510 [Patescibacteria group bacterium]